MLARLRAAASTAEPQVSPPREFDWIGFVEGDDLGPIPIVEADGRTVAILSFEGNPRVVDVSAASLTTKDPEHFLRGPPRAIPYLAAEYIFRATCGRPQVERSVTLGGEPVIEYAAGFCGDSGAGVAFSRLSTGGAVSSAIRPGARLRYNFGAVGDVRNLERQADAMPAPLAQMVTGRRAWDVYSAAVLFSREVSRNELFAGAAISRPDVAIATGASSLPETLLEGDEETSKLTVLSEDVGIQSRYPLSFALAWTTAIEGFALSSGKKTSEMFAVSVEFGGRPAAAIFGPTGSTALIGSAALEDENVVEVAVSVAGLEEAVVDASPAVEAVKSVLGR